MSREIICFREIEEDDLELLLAWRNHPKVYRHSTQQDSLLTWDEHYSWYHSREDRKDWIIVYDNGEYKRDIGSLSLKNTGDERPEIGIYIGEVTLHGQGLGTEALEEGLKLIEELGYETLKAEISKENKGSIALFKKMGFEEEEEKRGKKIFIRES